MQIDAAFLREIAAAAAAETLPRFRQKNHVSNKVESGFDPVTEADREAERAIRTLISARFPEHGIIGEELGALNPESRHVWVIDPVDGTRAFITGLPVWGTLAGLLVDGDAVAGMMAQPFTRELFYANGEGAFYEGPERSHPMRVSDTASLGQASLFTTSPHLFGPRERCVLDRLEAAVQLTRYGCDCYAFAMLAAGHVDMVIEAGLQSYDIVALIPLIEQAGGIITRWDGGPAESGGNILAAANENLWRQALEVIQEA